MPLAMGQPIVVIEKPSSNAGVVRFETNRAFTGMGHERYRGLDDIAGSRPPDQLARRLFEHGGVDGVHVNGNVVTVDLTKGHTSAGLKELIESLFLFYPPSDHPGEPQHTVESELEAGAGAAPELASDPGAVSAPDVSADEAPGRGGAEGPTQSGEVAADREPPPEPEPVRDERPAAGTLIEDPAPAPGTDPPPAESEDSAPTS
jgi:hypothetical protein